MFSFEICIFAALGLIFGSFTNFLAYRVEHDLPWFSFKEKTRGMSAGRSACPSCKHDLGVRDLIPVLSWVLLRGQCRYCQAPICIHYPIIEIVSAAVFSMVYVQFGFSVEAFIIALSLPVFISLFLIDLRRMILPNILMIGGYCAGVLLISWRVFNRDISIETAFMDHVLGAILFFVFAHALGWITTRILGKVALGGGDVKFFGVAGLFLGVSMLPLYCIVSGILGVLGGGIWCAVQKSKHFPFGPALIVALFAILLWSGSQTS